MKKFTILFLILGTISLFAQSSVAGYVGAGYSSFGLDNFSFNTEDQAGFVPVGVQITLGNGMLQFGGEVTYAMVPFTFEYQQNGVKVGEFQFTELFAGGFLRVNVGNTAIQPYAKAGGGAYMGKLKWEPEKSYSTQHPKGDEDFKTAYGFYVAAGLDLKLNKALAIFGEVPFHIVKRKLDVDGAESFSANHWAILAGIRIIFK